MGVFCQPLPVTGSGGSFASAECRAAASSGPHVGDGGVAAGGGAAGDCATADGAAEGGAVTVTVTGAVLVELQAVSSASAVPQTVRVTSRLSTLGVFHGCTREKSANAYRGGRWACTCTALSGKLNWFGGDALRFALRPISNIAAAAMSSVSQGESHVASSE